MIKFAVSCTVLAGAIWFAGFYKMGDKTLVGHLQEIYETPLVQQKVDALHKGLAGRAAIAVEKQKKAPKPRPMAAVETPPSPEHKAPPAVDTPPARVVDARPNTGERQKAPAHDNLTAEDRDDLTELLQKKLKK